MIRLVQVTLAAALTMALILMLGIMALRPAQAADTAWWSDCRHGWISKEFDAPDVSIDAPVHTTVTYDLSVQADGCYKAQSPPAFIGQQQMRDAGGHNVVNPLYTIYGCFNTL